MGANEVNSSYKYLLIHFSEMTFLPFFLVSEAEHTGPPTLHGLSLPSLHLSLPLGFPQNRGP